MKFDPALKLHCGEHPVFLPTAIVRTTITIKCDDGMVRYTARAQFANRRIIEVMGECPSACEALATAALGLDAEVKRIQEGATWAKSTS